MVRTMWRFFFCKLTYSVEISIGVTSNALLTGPSLLDTGASSNSVNKDFLPLACKESIKSIK